ncbi:MAG: DUF5681 domain-containing protein [Rudaea sp.]|nr:DUF5681 domain-containing protein [Rudaea sp.]
MEKKRKPPSTAWQKGQSGNPEGRPKGIPNPQARLRGMIDAEAIVARLQDAALAGDVQAARTLLERALPVYRSSAAPVDMPELAGALALADKAHAVLAAVSDGRLPPDLGASLVAAIGCVSKIEEVDELLRRVAVLEEARAQSSNRSSD